MKYEETVMDIGLDEYDGLGADTLVEIQAEISFKAGIEEAQRRLHSEEVREITEEALAEQRLVGIKEVVDLIHKYGVGYGLSQACQKLKDCGIDEIIRKT